MANITTDEVMRIAKLAMLNLSEEELENYTQNLREILAYAEMINQVDTEETEETIGVAEQRNVFRKDEVKEFKEKDKLLQNAPSQEEGMFRIPKVIN